MTTKKVLNKLTFESFIAKKLERDKDKVAFKEIEVPSLGETLLFERPAEEDILECLDQVSGNKNPSNLLLGFDKLLYNCCPTLKDTKLQEQMGVIAPYDIVKVMLEMTDRLTMGQQLLDFYEGKTLGAKVKK